MLANEILDDAADAFGDAKQRAISRYVYAALQGGSIMRNWTNDDRMMIACCNDGTRPVIFRIERIDIPENDEEREWLARQDCTNTAEDAYTGQAVQGEGGLNEEELCRELGKLTDDKAEREERIPYVASLLAHESTKKRRRRSGCSARRAA